MGDRWGDDGPPADAYSRVSRDLTSVTAGFATYLDGLSGRLLARFDCAVRPTTPSELERLRRGRGDVDEVASYAVVPSDVDGATLLVLRHVWQGGTAVSLEIGRATGTEAPDCFCDACDEDSREMIEDVESFVAMTTSGFHEFRRPSDGSRKHTRGWLEQGYTWAGGGCIGSNAAVRGEVFSAQWRAWPTRSVS